MPDYRRNVVSLCWSPKNVLPFLDNDDVKIRRVTNFSKKKNRLIDFPEEQIIIDFKKIENRSFLIDFHLVFSNRFLTEKPRSTALILITRCFEIIDTFDQQYFSIIDIS